MSKMHPASGPALFCFYLFASCFEVVSRPCYYAKCYVNKFFFPHTYLLILKLFSGKHILVKTVWCLLLSEEQTLRILRNIRMRYP